MRRMIGCFLLALAPAALASSDISASYVDPHLLDVPWGNYSFIRQGWRGYLETVPAARYRDGLGVVWGASPPHRSADQVATDLEWAGFRRVRLEIPWGSVKWDESGLDEASSTRVTQILRALKAHHLRPLILLNANHLQPCPVRWRDLVVQQSAAAGSRTLVVAGDVSGLGEGTATVMSLASGTEAGPLVDSVSQAEARGPNHVLELSKATTRQIAQRDSLRIAVLRYPPLYPLGSSEFAATAAGWLRYVALVTRLVEKEYGARDFDVEVWNELTFGSAFLDVANYGRSVPHSTPEFLHRGGSAWELASRTRALLTREHPQVTVIWGFSNTTFFHVHIDELPPRFDGQSYHPYGTGRRCYADLVRGRRELLLDAYVPDGCVVQPEGYAQAWQQTESLLRFLAPAARTVHPPGTGTFRHFITEHGFAPAEIGITDPLEVGRAKRGFVLRAPLLWLNKGVTALYLYDVYDPTDAGFGLFTGDGGISPALSALHRVTAEFAGPEMTAASRALSFQVMREGPQAGVLPGDPAGEHLPQEQAAALLPFQADAHRFVVAAYVMTQDFPHRLAPQSYRLTIHGVDGRNGGIRFYAPDTGLTEPVSVVAASSDSVTLRLSLTEVPRLIEINEQGAPNSKGDT
jgi:hypothetical protein